MASFCFILSLCRKNFRIVSVRFETVLFVSVVSIKVRNTETNWKIFFLVSRNKPKQTRNRSCFGSNRKILFLISRTPYTEVFSPQKRTSSSDRHIKTKTWNFYLLFSIFVFCGSFLPSWIRIANPDQGPTESGSNPRFATSVQRRLIRLFWEWVVQSPYL